MVRKKPAALVEAEARLPVDFNGFTLEMWVLYKYGPRLSVAQLVDALGISERFLRGSINDGSFPIPTYNDMGRRWADYRDVARHLNECRKQADAAV